MSRQHSLFLALAVVCGGALFLSNSARSQLGVAKNYVNLQATTPGAAQSGHSNVSGTSRAAQFVGGGAGVTDVNAAQLGGLAPSQYGVVNDNNSWIGLNTFSQPGNSFTGNGAGLHSLNASNIASGSLDSARLTNPLALEGTTSTGIISGSNLSTTGIAEGVRGQSLSTSGRGVKGIATSTTGDAIGLYGQSASTSGTGVFGFAFANSGSNNGVSGLSNSPNGIGVLASNARGGRALSTSGRSVFGGNIRVDTNFKLGIETDPVFPLDFSETLGNKISLWGTDPGSHFGFGIQSGQLQIFTDASFNSISFGFGGSGNFFERARLTSDATLAFLPGGVDVPTQFTTPYDTNFTKDIDNDSTGAWFRFFTNGGGIEHLRIIDGDEAPALFDGAVTANGIDYAEAFKVYDPTLEPGDLVINAGSNWEYIGRSMTPYDNSVIGVISTKPAFLAGLSFDAEDQIDPALMQRRDEARRKGDQKLEKALTMQMRKKAEEAHRPVAFMGRVPVKVVGVVKVGDHLTSSAIPGVAMAMTQPGHSIGIALEASSGGQAKVMGMIQPRFYAGPVAQGGLASVPEVKALQSRVQKLEEENAELRERLNRLEAAVLGKR